MNKQRIVVASIAAFGILTAFLPWVDVFGLVGVSGTEVGQWWVVPIIFVLAVGLALTGSRPYALDNGRRGAIGVLGAAAAGFGIWKLMEIKKGTVELAGEMGAKLKEQTGDVGTKMMGKMLGDNELLSVGFGVYALIGAGVALVIAVAWKKRSAG